MRIVSLLPSTTEILFDIGAGEDVVGGTFECEHPPEARTRTVVSTSAMPEGLAPAEIDAFVADAMRRGGDLYHLDAGALSGLDADLVVTQDLCAVCAVDVSVVDEALAHLGCTAEVLTIDPHTMDEVLGSVATLGKATGHEDSAERLVVSLRARLEEGRRRTAGLRRPRTLGLEWTDPPLPPGPPPATALGSGVDRPAVRAGPLGPGDGVDGGRLTGAGNSRGEVLPDHLGRRPRGIPRGGGVRAVRLRAGAVGVARPRPARRRCPPGRGPVGGRRQRVLRAPRSAARRRRRGPRRHPPPRRPSGLPHRPAPPLTPCHPAHPQAPLLSTDSRPQPQHARSQEQEAGQAPGPGTRHQDQAPVTRPTPGYQEAGSREQGAGNRELGAGSW